MTRTPTKPTANTTLNAESLSEWSSPKIRNKASISALTALIQIVLVVLDSAIRQEKAIKRHTDLKRKGKTVPICGCQIFYIENLSEPAKNLLEAN